MLNSNAWNHLTVYKQMINNINCVQKIINIKSDWNTWLIELLILDINTWTF